MMTPALCYSLLTIKLNILGKDMSNLTIITELVAMCASAAARASDDTLGSMADHPSLFKSTYNYTYIYRSNALFLLFGIKAMQMVYTLYQ
jgi:hypothetical protein